MALKTYQQAIPSFWYEQIRVKVNPFGESVNRWVRDAIEQKMIAGHIPREPKKRLVEFVGAIDDLPVKCDPSDPWWVELNNRSTT